MSLEDIQDHQIDHVLRNKDQVIINTAQTIILLVIRNYEAGVIRDQDQKMMIVVDLIRKAKVSLDPNQEAIHMKINMMIMNINMAAKKVHIITTKNHLIMSILTRTMSMVTMINTIITSQNRFIFLT